ncbi:hypothetical protein MAP00_001743 [Monascus purpureus]|nr:hypothetical protein MAP00_001743 [Monascus purpureus]
MSIVGRDIYPSPTQILTLLGGAARIPGHPPTTRKDSPGLPDPRQLANSYLPPTPLRRGLRWLRPLTKTGPPAATNWPAGVKVRKVPLTARRLTARPPSGGIRVDPSSARGRAHPRPIAANWQPHAHHPRPLDPQPRGSRGPGVPPPGRGPTAHPHRAPAPAAATTPRLCVAVSTGHPASPAARGPRRRPPAVDGLARPAGGGPPFPHISSGHRQGRKWHIYVPGSKRVWEGDVFVWGGLCTGHSLHTKWASGSVPNSRTFDT